MKDSFSMKEIMELIFTFGASLSHGYWKFEIEKCPEAQKFINAGYACISEEEPELYIINSDGDTVLHEYIEKISREFISFMRKQMNRTCLVEDAVRWFNENYDLNDVELSEEICRYICTNLHNYGYKIDNGYSSKTGSKYILRKIFS